MRPTRQLLSLIAAGVLICFLAGCASIGPPVPPSLELPKPPNDLRAVRKGERVYLFWTFPTQTIDRQNVRHPGPTNICRSLEPAMSECGTPVGSISVDTLPLLRRQHANLKLQAEYTDTLPADLQQQNPTRTITYAVEPLNSSGRSAGLSNQVRVPLAPTLPPPADFKAEVTATGIVLTWTCVQPTKGFPDISDRYRIYRRTPDKPTDLRLGDVDCPATPFEDHTFEWQKSYEYRITVLTVVGGENSSVVEGEDSPEQNVFANDVYPPGVPSGLQAVFSGPGQPPFVDLLWASDTDADLAGYNVYRREEGSQPEKINTQLVKTPAYRDDKVARGKTYWYSVSAVDLRGNESARSAEASEQIPQSPSTKGGAPSGPDRWVPRRIEGETSLWRAGRTGAASRTNSVVLLYVRCD